MGAGACSVVEGEVEAGDSRAAEGEVGAEACSVVEVLWRVKQNRNTMRRSVEAAAHPDVCVRERAR